MDLNLFYNTFFGNEYIRAALIFLGFFILAKLVVFLTKKYVLKITAKTKTQVDDLIVKKANRPLSYLIICIGIRIALSILIISEKALNMIHAVLYTVIYVLIFYVVIAIFDIVIDAWADSSILKKRTKINRSFVGLFHKFMKITVLFIAFSFILHIWGVEIGPLLASLGIAGIAIAFALQNTLGDVFGGISLIFDNVYKKGDIIKLDSGESGTIEQVGIRSTKIKTWNNEILIMPNGKIASSKIKNICQPDRRIRVDMEFGVNYDSDPDKVKKVALDVVKKAEHVLKDPAPNIWFLEMGDFSLKFKLMFYVDDLSNKWLTHQVVITNLFKSLKKNKIGIPFPTRTLYMKKAK